ncbi:MAG: hypothetical protein PF636_09425 [Actinomycetota bacterium]|jgi:hypothetical protein|nr:hypothetical protein [Actinomycetota bacterium]
MPVEKMPASRLKAGVLIVAALITAVLVALSPEDQTLGPVVRLLYFHGALTWVNLATFSFAAAFAAFYLVRGDESPYRWASAFRYVSLGLWALNTWMGVESMRMIWGGIKWDEPRLRMTFWVMIGALLVFALDLILHRWRLTAAMDVGIAVLLWYLLLTTPMEFHPDSPVFNSGPDIIAFFLWMGITMFVATLAATWMLRDRLGRPEA